MEANRRAVCDVKVYLVGILRMTSLDLYTMLNLDYLSFSTAVPSRAHPSD
jgi:hypothetical protein